MAKMTMASLATSLSNQEVRRLTNAGAVLDWFPEIPKIWIHAMGHISHLNLASQESPRCFVLPPIHLFWGGKPENQWIYYYHYLLLFNEIKNRPEHNLPALTTQEWRSILGNTYWKKQWPKHDARNPLAFDPDMFWKYGGSLLFSSLWSADVAAGYYNPTSQLSCRCHVQLSTADDIDIHQVVLYYLNSFHMYEEIKEMVRTPPVPNQFREAMEASDTRGQPDCGDVGPIRRQLCQCQLFLQQEGVEKLGSGSTWSHCRLGWFWWLELGAIFKCEEYRNQQALRARAGKVLCLSACIFHSFICPMPGLLPVTPTTSSSYLRWPCLCCSSEKVWLQPLQSSSLYCIVDLGPPCSF